MSKLGGEIIKEEVKKNAVKNQSPFADFIDSLEQCYRQLDSLIRTVDHPEIRNDLNRLGKELMSIKSKAQGVWKS
jgi:hypothetical protein